MLGQALPKTNSLKVTTLAACKRKSIN